MPEAFIRSGVPTFDEPCLKTKSTEVGVNFDRLIAGIGTNRQDMEMAQEFGVTEKTIHHLRNHFERFGLGTLIGQD
jgi:hypothetical protein